VIVGTVTSEDIRDAAERIAGRIRRTPVIELGEIREASVVAKLELLQHTGSFKPRGAFNKLLSSEVPPAGVIAASGGNFGSAVAYAAREVGVTAELFIVEGYWADAQDAASVRAAETGALLMHPFDQPEVIAGGGTLGIEIEEQVPDVDSVLMGVGGGGPLAGIAAWCGDRVRVIGVEPQGCASMTAALAAGEPVAVPVSGLGSDSLGAARVGDHVFPIVRDRVDRMALVTEDQIRDAQRALWNDVRLIVEPGGAAAFAALRSGAVEMSPGERVCVVLSGGNCDPASVIS
jgi:threonine dehydratase